MLVPAEIKNGYADALHWTDNNMQIFNELGLFGLYQYLFENLGPQVI